MLWLEPEAGGCSENVPGRTWNELPGITLMLAQHRPRPVHVGTGGGYRLSGFRLDARGDLGGESYLEQRDGHSTARPGDGGRHSPYPRGSV